VIFSAGFVFMKSTLITCKKFRSFYKISDVLFSQTFYLTSDNFSEISKTRFVGFISVISLRLFVHLHTALASKRVRLQTQSKFIRKSLIENSRLLANLFGQGRYHFGTAHSGETSFISWNILGNGF